MPSLPLTATQQAPLQSLFASSPFDTITDTPARRDSSSRTINRPRSASVCQPAASSNTTPTPHPTLAITTAPRRASASASTTTTAPPLPTPLASLTFTTVGQCHSVTLPNPTTQPYHLQLTPIDRKRLRMKGFRLPDVKNKLTVPARSERPLVVVWEGRRKGGVESEEDEVVGGMVVHELRLVCTNQSSSSVVIRLSATLPLSPPSTTAPLASSSPVRSTQRRPLRKLTEWLSAGFTSALPKHTPTKADLFTTHKGSRNTRSNSTSTTATHSTASSSSFSTPPSPTADDEWSSPRHASEPAVLSPLHHSHCYTLTAADVYTHSDTTSAAMDGSGSGSGSPSQPIRNLSSEAHSRSFLFPVQVWPLVAGES